MKVTIEAGFWFTIEAASAADAEAIIADLRIKHPQTQETIAPQWTKAWRAFLGITNSGPKVTMVVDDGS